MKTAATIEAQTERKKDEKDSLSDGDLCPQNSAPVRATRDRRKEAERIRPWQFKPGQSGNPGGRPKHDVASEIAQALFMDNPDLIYEAFLKVLKKGSPYGFQVLADRAFGKLKEIHQIDHSPYKDASDEDIEARILELKRKLGWPEPESKTVERKPN
jgi:hypothetical protein